MSSGLPQAKQTSEGDQSQHNRLYSCSAVIPARSLPLSPPHLSRLLLLYVLLSGSPSLSPLSRSLSLLHTYTGSPHVRRGCNYWVHIHWHAYSRALVCVCVCVCGGTCLHTQRCGAHAVFRFHSQSVRRASHGEEVQTQRHPDQIKACRARHSLMHDHGGQQPFSHTHTHTHTHAFILNHTYTHRHAW